MRANNAVALGFINESKGFFITWENLLAFDFDAQKNSPQKREL
jgi:hypothetical protein